MYDTDLNIDARLVDGRLELTIRGEIDLASRGPLAAVLERTATCTQHVALDLSAVTFLDSSGLKVLVQIARQLEHAGGELTISAASHPVERVLELTGLQQLMHRSSAPVGV